MILKTIQLLLLVTASAIAKDVQNRIYNGNLVNTGENKYLVKIAVPSYCSASIIGSTWVLTAAHCVEGSLKKRYVFHHSQPLEPIAYITESYIHQEPHGSQLQIHVMIKKDIAMLKTTPIQFNENIQPINLASRFPMPNERAMISGYGDTNWAPGGNVPFKGDVQIQKCKEELLKNLNMICLHGRIGAGGGDSGGRPLVTKDGQVGVQTLSECPHYQGRKTCGTISVSVADNLAWISSLMESQ